MELIKTTPEIAKSILDSGKRTIIAIKNAVMYKVVWINTNNQTASLSKTKSHEFMQNNEDLEFYIQVPKNAKTVY